MEKSKFRSKAILTATVIMAACLTFQDADAKRRDRNAPRTNNNTTVVSGDVSSSPQRAYAALLSQKQSLEREADNLTAQMSGAKRSRINKLTKQLDAVNAQLVVVERKMAAYPRSITDPSYRAEQEQQSSVQGDLRRELDQRTAVKMAELDFDNRPATSDDPELQRAYRLYQQYGEEAFTREEVAPHAGVAYRVQIATGLPGHTNSFRGVSDVMEVDNGKGTSVYYAGTYTSYDAAQKACREIRESTRYKDALVVAMDGNRRISIEEARRQLR